MFNFHQDSALLRNVNRELFINSHEDPEPRRHPARQAPSRVAQTSTSSQIGLRSARSSKHGRDNYKVTLETRQNSNDVIFRFSPINEKMDKNEKDKSQRGPKATTPRGQLRRKIGSSRPPPQAVDIRLPQGSPGPSSHEPRPGPSRSPKRSQEEMLEEKAPESRAVKMKKVEIEIKKLLEELFPEVTDELFSELITETRPRSRRGNRENNDGSCRRRRRSSNSRRRRREREELFYEVEDLEHEIIKEDDLPTTVRCGNWRVFPKYALSEKEAARQEAELFTVLQNETKPEPIRPPEPHEPSCCVCYENAATRIVIPCGHLCLCYDCSRNIVTNRATFYGSRVPKLCPICQAAIGLLTRIN